MRNNNKIRVAVAVLQIGCGARTVKYHEIPEKVNF
jgi:hypothetical protein